MNPAPQTITRDQLAKTIDHALLRPEMTRQEVKDGCQLALICKVAAVCVRPCDVILAADHLGGRDVLVAAVVGFPHGGATTSTKACEATEAVRNGAAELDMVVNLSALIAHDLALVEADIRAVVESGAIVKVILENAYLDEETKVLGCKAAERAGAHYVKTSTGFAPSGATVEDVRLMRASIDASIGVKASGGIRSTEEALSMIAAGATRLGTSSTIAILAGIPETNASLP